MSSRARLAVIVCFGLAALVFARLGFWQVSRLQERRAANVLALEARSAPRIRLDGATPITAELDGREVRRRATTTTSTTSYCGERCTAGHPGWRW